MSAQPETILEQQKQYLNNEIWVLTIGGGFQRSGVYPDGVSAEAKEDFKKQIRLLVERVVLTYDELVSPENHIKNISVLVKTYQCEGESIDLKFGIAQKIFNLYLKYQWCLGWIKIPPPHFPVDRLIQIKLNQRARKLGLNTQPIESWTKFKNAEDYLYVVDFADKVRKSDGELIHLSLAELELELFNRRSDQ